MIPGFERETHELTVYERDEILPAVLAGLKKRVGKANAVTSDVIITKMTALGFKISGPRVRKVINHIRTNGMLDGLLASSSGYWVSKDKGEIEEYAQSLQSRENEIRRVKDGILRYLKTL